MVQTLEWTDSGVRFIDQTKLPTEEAYVTCKTYEQVADAIRNMVVRGAPAIGVAAAMGIALGVKSSKAETVGELKPEFDRICEVMGDTRPTAVNLFWAIRRMREKFELLRVRPLPQLKQAVIDEARRMHAEDIAANQAMGRHGATLMPASGGVLTHCNAGALATCGYGTALGVIRAAVEPGKKLPVYADETRSIPIEQRNPREVTHMAGKQMVPDGIGVENPAFDVTPAKYVSAIVTEKGIAHEPYGESLRKLSDDVAVLQH